MAISGDGNRRKVSEDCRKCIKDKYDQEWGKQLAKKLIEDGAYKLLEH